MPSDIIGKAVAQTGVAVTAAVVVTQTSQVALRPPVEGTAVTTSWSTELSEAALQARALTGAWFAHRIDQTERRAAIALCAELRAVIAEPVWLTIALSSTGGTGRALPMS